MNSDHSDHPSPLAGKLSRRSALERMSAGALLALGLWPGALRAEGRGNSGSFRFAVVNDTHHVSPECGTYLEGAVRQMRAARPEFCLHAGDLTDKGQRDNHGAVRDIFKQLRAPFYPVIGNHDYATPTDRKAYTTLFPLRVNYYFRHRGWQFVGLDTSDGQRYEKIEIQPATFRWLDDYLPRLDKTKPTVVFTHFPLGLGVKYRPTNADALLDRFREFNLQAVFNGHYHAFTERTAGGFTLTTNRCCAYRRDNHDQSKEKGYFVGEAKDGKITREFVEYQSPLPAYPGTENRRQRTEDSVSTGTNPS